MKIILIIFCVIAFNNYLFSQGEISDKKAYNINEKTIAFCLNSNGGGVNYRYGKRLDGTRRRIFDIDAAIVKHPKEIKTNNPYYDTNNSRFVFGKLNYFFNTKTGIGLQKELYSKFDKGGVAIKYFYSGGFSLGILKPIYYDIIILDTTINDKKHINTIPQKFNYSIHTSSDIYGKTAFFEKGMDEIELIPGIHTKFGLSIEYSKNDKLINAIEVGASIDAYLKEVLIMATEKNNQIFVALFISYRFGKVYTKKDL